jgi:DNA-binding MarR family transcriptional regulator
VNARADVEVRPTWTFLTNHAHVLIAVAADREARVRDIAERVGITERAVQGILDDLERGGYLERERVGRRNRYTLREGGRFRHPAERGHAIDELLRLFR